MGLPVLPTPSHASTRECYTTPHSLSFQKPRGRRTHHPWRVASGARGPRVPTNHDAVDAVRAGALR